MVRIGITLYLVVLMTSCTFGGHRGNHDAGSEAAICLAAADEKYVAASRPCTRATYECAKACEETLGADKVACKEGCLSRDPAPVCRLCWKRNTSFCLSKACPLPARALKCCISSNCRSEFMDPCIETNCYVEADRMRSCHPNCDAILDECFTGVQL